MTLPPDEDVRAAVVTVLRESEAPLHWTTIQDRALRAGLIDPFTSSDVRRRVLRALHDLVIEGIVSDDVGETKGVFALVRPVED